MTPYCNDPEAAFSKKQLLEEMEGKTYDSIAIFAHARTATFGIGADDLQYDDPFWAQVGSHIRPGGRIYLLGCDIGYGSVGQTYVDGVGKTSGVQVWAPQHYMVVGDSVHANGTIDHGYLFQAASKSDAYRNKFLRGFPWTISK